MTGSGARRIVPLVCLLACLATAAIACVLTSRTPAPLGPDAPPAVFSAGRAMADDRVIAARPHPEGSPEAKAARDYIVGRMAALGLSPRRVTGEAVEVFPRLRGRLATGGVVENLIGVLPGRDPAAPAVLLMAHSDSVPGSPGAADDAAGVASALEIVRALKAEGPQRRDVVVLITDGEEAGLLGARAFFASGDPLMRHIGVVVNMEARGGGGRVAMFETGARNGPAMALFAHAVKNTDAVSLMSEVYKYMPNSTDFTVSKAAGYPGYNFAFAGEEFDYHSPSSTAAVLDQGAVQHMGDQALAVVRALEAAPTLPPRAADAIYSDVLGGPVIVYPPWVGWVLAAAAAVLVVVGVRVGARRAGEAIRPLAAAQGAGAALLSLLLGMLALHTAARLMGADDLMQGRRLMAACGVVFIGAALLAASVWAWVWFAVFAGRGRWIGVAGAAGLTMLSCLGELDPLALGLGGLSAVLALAVLGRPAPVWSGWLGAMALGLVLTAGLQAVSPPLTTAIAWPALLGALGVAASAVLGRGRFEGGALLAATAFAALTAAYLGHLAGLIFVAVGTTTPEALALVPFLASFAFVPLFSGEMRRRGMWFASGGAVFGLVILFGVAVASPWTARTPRAVQAFYFEDLTAASAWRASALQTLDPWSRAALASGGQIVSRSAPPYFERVWLSPAPLIPRAALKVVFDRAPGANEGVLRITPDAGVRELRLYLQPTTPLQDARLNGRPTALQPAPGGWSQLRWTAPTGPVSVTFAAKGGGALDLRYEEILDSLPPGAAFPAKPADVMPWGLSDKTVIVGGFTARW